MIKNLLAVVGLAVLVRKSYALYCDYQKMKDENAYWRRRTEGEPCGPVPADARDPSGNFASL